MLALTCPMIWSFAQPAKGKLFIIGGGDRTPALMQAMMQAAQLEPADYIAILPMSGENPDTSFYYINADLKAYCSNPVVNLNFTKETAAISSRLDSLKRAKLIFITGGDQSRFMSVVSGTPVYDAIHAAYANGATIAGTSAGAAVMSRHMVTGNQLRGDTTYHSTFDRIWDNNIEFSQGLGLLGNVIIDQHFVVRSRYNRMISALASYPTYTCIGIDESTAIIVSGNTVRVAGESQVLVMKSPEQMSTANGLIKFKDVQFAIYTPGDSFMLE